MEKEAILQEFKRLVEIGMDLSELKDQDYLRDEEYDSKMRMLADEFICMAQTLLQQCNMDESRWYKR